MRLVIAGKTWEALYTDLALSTVYPWIEPVQVLSVLTCAVTMPLLCGCYVVAMWLLCCNFLIQTWLSNLLMS